MRKTLLTLVLFFGTLLISCIKQGECPPVKPYFRVKSLSAYNLKFTYNGLNPWTVVNSTDTVKWDSYFVRVGFNSEYYANDRNFNQFNSGNSLFALSCNGSGYKGSTTGVKNIYFITLNDYNSKYLMNDTVNEIIRLNYWTYTIRDFKEFFPISDFSEQNSEGFSSQNFEFKITEAPSDDIKSTQFKIILELKNGEKFETNTTQIRLNK